MEQRWHILVVDDNPEILDLLTRFLSQHGMRVSTAADGEEMGRILTADPPDLVVLDLMLPGEDGLTICRRLRVETDMPVIMLTAMGEETDRIVGLEVGADDYLPKPFNPRELLARIKAVLRRSRDSGEAAVAESGRRVYCFEGWRFAIDRRQLFDPAGTEVPLSSGEYALLLALVQHPQRTLSRDQLLDLARGRDAMPFDRSIDTQVSRLRRKIEADPQNPRLVKTVWGAGYIFTPRVTLE